MTCLENTININMSTKPPLDKGTKRTMWKSLELSSIFP